MEYKVNEFYIKWFNNKHDYEKKSNDEEVEFLKFGKTRNKYPNDDFLNSKKYSFNNSFKTFFSNKDQI